MPTEGCCRNYEDERKGIIMKKHIQKILVALLSLSILVGSNYLLAATPDWPKKPIQIIVPYAPGGDLDFNARTYALHLGRQLGKPVIVVNISGSSGIIGCRKVKDAAPDGYTVLLSQPSLMINKLAGTADFGLEAFEMVALAAYVPGDLVVVNAKSGIKTFKDLAKYTKANPGKLKVAAAMGTMNYIEALQMIDNGLNINIVNAGDAAARVAALKGGHVDLILNSYGTVVSYLLSGDFIALGTTNKKRNKAFAKIPTCVEQGYNVSFDKYFFFAMPKGTPKAIVNKFSQAVKAVSKNTEYRNIIYKTYGQLPYYKAADESLKELNRIDVSLQKYKDRFGAQK
jgi:tripartite-type tricarboxylate transporter receptor subunit TctC